jgi:hypothetical protein
MNKVLAIVTSLAAALLLAAATSTAMAQQDYKTPQDAVDALVASAKSGDDKAALVVLGQDGQDIISSGDKVSDDAVRARFVASYDAKHQVAMEGDNKATLVIGDNDYPFPIPLHRNKNGTWSFDTDEGRIEVLARRIGHNELDTIQTSLAYVDAQNDYAAKDRGAGIGAYAQRFISTEGKKDGLYWPTAQGEEESPLGGAADYVVNGKMIGGFGLVAYPAEYRNSGVMTFIVNHDGTVFQKDLGPKTDEIADAITAFNPDKGWTKVEPAQAAK